MHCPVCKIDMFSLEYQLLEVDYCRDCGGVWLDSGEIELLGERAGIMQLGLLAALDNPVGGEADYSRRRRCPVCQKALMRVRPPDLAPVGVDRCPNKHGLWFDRGELQQIVARVGVESSALLKFLGDLEERRRKGELSGGPAT